MNSKKNLWCWQKLILAVLLLTLGISPGFAQTTTTPENTGTTPLDRMLRRVTQADREAAAARAAEAKLQKSAAATLAAKPTLLGAVPGGVPDYFGNPNWANSPVPTTDPKTKKLVGGMKKFVDTLPGLGPNNKNNLGQYIPVAVADTTTFPGSDYYRIGIVDFTQQLHSGLPPTKLRGYADLAGDGQGHYLGPLIIAKQNRPVRVLATNMLGTGTAGNLFIPVDTTVMGAGMGPLGMAANPMNYTQNRAVIHLHGGATPWISDGTPHQWFTPAGETSPYTEGRSFQSVPDMPIPPAGSNTYYYTNQQSNRLMFYHDHAYGTTRLDVYAGEVAPYLVTDPIEENLINQGLLPEETSGEAVYRYGIPLIIQDKTFVDTNTIGTTDPTWNWGTTPPVAHQGDLWMPHVYMPNQNPFDNSGVNPFGRWDYGPWFWPPLTPATGLVHGPIPDPLNPARQIPGTPNPSMAMETFMDTPLVNGTAYPVLTVQHQPYRFRILNGCNERYLNLQLYFVDPRNPTEVKMVPAVATKGYPATWPTDGRAGGVPDPKTAGPQMIQIGTEGGFLPMPAIIPNQPINYIYDRRNIVVLNVSDHALLMGPAERADVIIDFSQVPKNAKIILYNDAPAPIPAFDPRLDYYTGDPDLTSTGGAPTTLAGYGPNTRTIMLFQVAGNPVRTSFNLAALQAVWPQAYAADQAAPVVPQTTYPPPYQAATDSYVRIQDNFLTYTPVGGSQITSPLGPKAIQELFELDYGRMNATLGVELPLTNFNTQTTIPLGYIDLQTEELTNNGVQLWKITHNGVDTHAVHFHLFNVQLVNRVGWDGAIRPPDANELGWKETVRMNPLEDAIVALQPALPQLPFPIPESIRPLDPTMPDTAMINVTSPVDGNIVSVLNYDPNNPAPDPYSISVPARTIGDRNHFGWEYVWHCHMLGHEEMDFMRPMNMAQGVAAADYVRALPAPFNLTAIVNSITQVTINWLCNCPPGSGHRVERATEYGAFTTVQTLGDVLTYTDTVPTPGIYRYRVCAFSPTEESMASPTVTVSMTIPVAPYNMAAVNVPLSSNPPSVNLSWDNDAYNATGVNLQRSSNKAFPPASTTTFNLGPNATTYTDTTVAKHTGYYYRTYTFNGMGSSAFSNLASVKTTGQVPVAPTGLTAVTGTAARSIAVSWTPAANSTATRILRSSVGAAGPWVALGNVANSKTSFVNGGLAPNTTYWYTAQAVNADGYSVSTAAVSATTLP